jgi:hypothetical protein
MGCGGVSCAGISLKRLEAALNCPAKYLVIKNVATVLYIMRDTDATVCHMSARSFAASTTPSRFAIGMEIPLREPSSNGAATMSKGRAARTRAGEKYIPQAVTWQSQQSLRMWVKAAQVLYLYTRHRVCACLDLRPATNASRSSKPRRTVPLATISLGHVPQAISAKLPRE